MTAQEDVEQIRNIIETGEAFRSLCAQIDNLQAEKEQCEAEQAMHAAMIKDKVCTLQVSAIPESSIDLLLKNAGKQGVDDPDGVKCLAEGVPYQIGSDVEFVPDYDAEVEDIEAEDVSEDQPETPENE